MEYIESRKDKRIFKTATGIEIKPSLLYLHKESGQTSDQAYYYAWYYHDKSDGIWKVRTNQLLYGEIKDLVICKDRQEAEKIAGAINHAIHLLAENINK